MLAAGMLCAIQASASRASRQTDAASCLPARERHLRVTVFSSAHDRHDQRLLMTIINQEECYSKGVIDNRAIKPG